MLVFLTAMAALPVDVVGPFDARTCEPAQDVRVEYSPAGAVLEPVTALEHVIAGAPNVRVAVVWVPIWIVSLAACASAAGYLRRNRWRVNWRTPMRAVVAGLAGLFVLTVYGFFAVLVRIPNWRAVARDPDIVLVDLHTHTFGSHDGLISARDNLRWQARRGCGVVGVVEHGSFKGSLAAAALSERDESLPPVLPGAEVYLTYVGYVVVFGPRERMDPNVFAGSYDDFIQWFHQNVHGVVLSVQHQRDPEKIDQSVRYGVDGFEIANDGHPDVQREWREHVLAAAEGQHLPLVASTDWHGISGVLRTWTAVRVPRAAGLSRQARADAVLDALRRHDCQSITPLVVGRMRAVSLAEAILTPFTEIARYAIGLSGPRVLAWWIWGAAILLLATGMLNRGIRPGRLMLAAALAAMGIAISVQGLRLIVAHVSGQAPFDFPYHVGLGALGTGLAAMLFGTIGVWHALTRRRVRQPSRLSALGTASTSTGQTPVVPSRPLRPRN